MVLGSILTTVGTIVSLVADSNNNESDNKAKIRLREIKSEEEKHAHHIGQMDKEAKRKHEEIMYILNQSLGCLSGSMESRHKSLHKLLDVQLKVYGNDPTEKNWERLLGVEAKMERNSQEDHLRIAQHMKNGRGFISSGSQNGNPAKEVTMKKKNHDIIDV